MSAHNIFVEIKGHDLKKYEPELVKILNKGFHFDWFFNTEVTVTDDCIRIWEETKNCDFKKLVSAVNKGMPEADEVYYHCEPYWKNQAIHYDNLDDEFAYWTSNKEYRSVIFGDKRMKWASFEPCEYFIQQKFDKWRKELNAEPEVNTDDFGDEVAEDSYEVIAEVYDEVVSDLTEAIDKHTYISNRWYIRRV